MAKKSTAPKRFHRCRVVLNIYRGDKSVSLGPGSLMNEQEYAELIASGDARADCFEEIAGEPEAAPEESEKEE